MIPITLSISGFLSYRDPVEISFTDFDLACIAGPNGAGKSSLLDAITWALFGEARKRDDSLINAQSSVARVCYEFAYEGNVYRVERAKPKEKTAVLEFSILYREDGQPAIWRPLTEHTLRETQSRIEQTLRMDYDTFINASFFLQGKADQFTTHRSAERKKLLGSILGLEIWDEYKSTAAGRRKSVELEIYQLDGQLKEINTELDEEPLRRTRLKELQAELKSLADQRQAQEQIVQHARQAAATLQEQERLVDTLRRQLEAAERRLIDQQARLAARQNEMGQQTQLLEHAAEIETAYAGWQAARQELVSLEASAGKFHAQEKLRETPRLALQAARSRLEQELQGFLQRQSEAEKARQDADALQVQIHDLQDEVSQAEARVERRGQLETQFGELREQQAGLKQANQRLKDDMDELRERIQRLQETEGAECPLCGQPLSPADRLALIERLEAQGRAQGDQYRSNLAAFDADEQKAAALSAEITGLKPADAQSRQAAAKLAARRSQWEMLEKTRADWEAAGAPRLAQIQSALDHDDYEPEARQRLQEIEAALAAIGYDGAAHDAARSAEEAGRASETRLRELEKARAALAPLQREIEGLESQIAVAESDVDGQRDEHSRAALALAAAKQAAPDVNAAEDLLYKLSERENKARMDLGAASQKVAVLDDLKRKRDALESQREEYARLSSRYKQLERAFGRDGVPALLIEQALPEIETRANDVLTRLSDGAMSVRFVTQAQYKDKNRDDLKETLDIQISDGVSVREYELFSGGEAFRVNFAIRLALSEVLAQRAGARLQMLVIDEGFGSQDQLGRQRLVEAINLVRHDFAKILVITHIDELKDAFPNRIEVEKTSLGSVVKVV